MLALDGLFLHSVAAPEPLGELQEIAQRLRYHVPVLRLGSIGGSVGGGLGLAEGFGWWAAECSGAVSWLSLPPSLVQFQNRCFPHPNFKDESPERVTVVSGNGICGYFKISQNPSC